MNSRLFYLLLANVAFLAANLWFFSDKQTESSALSDAKPVPLLQQKNSSEQLVKKDEKSFVEIDETNSVALATSNENEESSPAQQKLNNSQKDQQQAHQELLRLYQQQQAQLAALKAQNNRLADKVTSLQNQVIIKDEYLAQSRKKEQELSSKLDNQQKQLQQQKLALSSPVEEIKSNIELQPDLLRSKPGNATTNSQPTLTEDVLADSSNVPTPIETDVVSSLEEDKKYKEPFTGAIEFGFKYERDNQLTQGLHGRLVLDYDEVDQYHINSDLEFEFESEDKVNTTEKYRWQLQTDYHLDQKNILFARSDLQRSKFASYEQEDVFTVGYGRIFFNDEKHKFNTEIGPGYKFAVPNIPEEAVSMNEFILRTRLNYERILSNTLQVSLEGVAEFGKANSVFTFEFKGQKRIYRELYLVFEFDYKYNENVPVDTEHDELSTGFSIMYAF